MTLVEAYARCREIARREAKNFYWSFRVLPRHKSDAMCAVYAFMRKADDLADDEAISLEQRRVLMAEWLHAWRLTRAGGATDDPVFLALNDTQRRFAIPDSLLEELVQGTTMDLQPLEGVLNIPDPIPQTGPSGSGGVPSEYQVYADFDALHRYCYLVASVVGLVCIRIFGYGDPAAVPLAEETGVAFQLTNILRDVREDAERGRIYLPFEDLSAHGSSVMQVVAAVRQGEAAPQLTAVLQYEAERAQLLYTSANRLLPMIDPDGRAALWVMVEIYHALLKKIQHERYRVFGERVSVSTPHKLAILARGALMAVRLRI